MYRSINNDIPKERPNTEFIPRSRRQNPPIIDQFKSAWLTGLVGCMIFSAGMWLLFWNEGKTVRTCQDLDEAMNSVVSLQTSSIAYPENSGHLIHVGGVLSVGEPLTEPEYGVSIPAVKLKRRVQMYQWVEEEYRSDVNREDEPASYSYSTEWKDKLISSSKFRTENGHHNPKEIPMKSTVYISEDVTVGNFILGDELKEKFNDFVLVTSDERPERRDIRLHAGLYYHTQDVWKPEVGDIRVQFSYAGKAGDVVSVIAMQVGNRLEAYKNPNNKKDLLLLKSGFHSVEDMLRVEHGLNWSLTWAFRGVGWALLYLGTNFSTTIIRLLVSRYSILYDVLVLGTGNINMAISISMALLVMSLAWIWYRPILGLFLITTAGLPFIWSAVRIYKTDARENRHYRRI